MDVKELKGPILRDPLIARLADMAKSAKVPLFLVGGFLRDLCLQEGAHFFQQFLFFGGKAEVH